MATQSSGRSGYRVEDPDDQDLQYYLMDGPSGLTIDREYGTIRWNPGEWWSQDGTSMVGSYQASIAVVDSAGNADIRSVIVNVAENSGEAVITGPTKIVLDENSSREIFVDVEYLTSSDQQNDFRAEVTSSGVVATIVKGEEWVGRFCNMNTLVIQVGSGLAGEFQIAVEVFMDESSIKTYTIPVIVVGGDAEMKFKYFYAYPPLLQGNVQENVKFGAVVDSSNRENNIIQLFEASSDGTILDLQTPICELVDIGSCDSNDEGDNNLCCTVPMNIQAGDRRYYRVRSHNQISGISTLSDGVVEVRATTHERQMEIPETENILIDPVDGVMMLGNVLQVEFAESASDFEMQTAAQSIGGLLSGATYFRNNWVISFPEVEDVGDLQALESSIRTNNPGIVESATPVFLIETAVQQFPCEEIKLDRRKQWYLDKLHMESVWMMARGGSRIAVLDSGVDLEHPALDGTIDSAECVDLTNTPYTANVTDYSGHGTNVSGIIAAEGNSDTNNTEFHGMSYGTRVVHFKTVTMKMGKYSSLTTLTQRALILAIAKDIRVVNISQALSTLLCADPKYQVTMQMFRDLSEILDAAGVTVVVSAGNDNTDGNHLYGCIGDNVIGVGGTGEDDNAWTVSINQGTNYGENVDIAAPAASIVTTRSFEENSGFWDNARDYECPGFCRVLGGTSLAAPMVAAAASMVDGFRGRTVEPSEMRRILMDSATRLSDKYAPGGIKPLGSGRLNILEALFHGGFEGARGRDNIGEFGITYTCYAHDDHEWVDCSFGIAPKVGVRFDQFEPKHGRGMLIMEMNTKGDIDIWTYLVVHKKFTILDGYDRMSISFWMNMITEDIAAIQNRPELGIQNHEVWLTIRAPSDEEHVYELIETCCDWPGEFGFESWKSGELDENDISFTDWRRLEYDYHLIGAGGEGSAVGSIAGEWDIELQVITRTNSALDESADRTIVLIDEIGVSGHEIGHP